MKRVNCFTLVELLVVIGIISVLAGLLLPALHGAMKQARRITCLNDRKQGGLSVHLYAGDHRDRLPSATAFRDANGYEGLEPSGQTHWHGATNNASPASHHGPQPTQTHEGVAAEAIVFALGTLARKGYMDTPDALSCSTFERSDSTFRSVTGLNYDSGFAEIFTNKAGWQSLTSGILLPTGLSFRYRLSIAHLFHSHDPTPKPYPWGAVSGGAYASFENMTFSKVAQNWKKSNQVSPFLMACGNWRWSNAHGDNLLLAGFGISHEGEGLNSVLYDGSARWISLEEVAGAGWVGGTAGQSIMGQQPAAFLLNSAATYDDDNCSNFTAWAKKYTGE